MFAQIDWGLVILTALFGWLIVFAIFNIVREPILYILNFFCPDLVFKTRLSMAERGFYKYDGSMIFAEIRGYPVGVVLYKDGKKSRKMALGNAVDYKDMFGGVVLQS